MCDCISLLCPYGVSRKAWAFREVVCAAIRCLRGVKLAVASRELRGAAGVHLVLGACILEGTN